MTTSARLRMTKNHSAWLSGERQPTLAVRPPSSARRPCTASMLRRVSGSLLMSEQGLCTTRSRCFFLSRTSAGRTRLFTKNSRLSVGKANRNLERGFRWQRYARARFRRGSRDGGHETQVFSHGSSGAPILRRLALDGVRCALQRKGSRWKPLEHQRQFSTTRSRVVRLIVSVHRWKARRKACHNGWSSGSASDAPNAPSRTAQTAGEAADDESWPDSYHCSAAQVCSHG